MEDIKNNSKTKEKELSKKILTIFKILDNEIMKTSGQYKLTIAKERELAKKVKTTHVNFKKALEEIIKNNLFFEEEYNKNKSLVHRRKIELEKKRKKNRERQRAYYNRKKEQETREEYRNYYVSIYVIFELFTYLNKISTDQEKKAIEQSILQVKNKVNKKNIHSKKISILDFIEKVEEYKQENLINIYRNQRKKEQENNLLENRYKKNDFYNKQDKSNKIIIIILLLLGAFFLFFII